VRLRALAPAKFNLCLFLGGPRADGRHELVTLFESLSLADEVELSTRIAMVDQVRCRAVEGPNIVARALELLRSHGWDAPRVRVEIRKRIPIAAGLGGGSADAAALLRIAQRLSPLAPEAIGEIALDLGADVPSQLEPGAALGTGAGDQVVSVGSRAPHALVLVPQPHALATADVYRRADELGLPRGRDELDAALSQLEPLLLSGAELPSELIVNDLERAAVSLCPPVADALDAVREGGADHALVCGSGPTVAGLFWETDGSKRAREVANRLSGRFPGTCTAKPVDANFGAPLFT
jgi:4-diphosphocytidyl-2-C-methyl-D-erythritol kinase